MMGVGANENLQILHDEEQYFFVRGESEEDFSLTLRTFEFNFRLHRTGAAGLVPNR
jgi:hypothetical protein